MPTVKIYHEDGSVEEIPTTTDFARTEQLGRMTQYTATVDRGLADTVSLTPKRDEIELVGLGRGPLTNIDAGGETTTLTFFSPEWYATLVEPTDGGTLSQGTDADIITSLVNRVGEWTLGSVAELTNSLTFVFNHAFAHEALRKVERNVPGELRFGDDGTVDYVTERGSDRSGSVTLSPAAGTIEAEITITEQGRTLDATHVRVLGAHEGEAQLFATLVPDDDPDTYENRVNYTTPRWSAGDPKDWDRYQNKDVMAQDTIESEAITLGEELGERYVEAEAVVSGVDPRLSLGDFVRVVKPSANLDRVMRVHRSVTTAAPDTPAGIVQEVTLSTRTIAREELGSDARDIQRFNTAFQGSSVVIQGGGGRQPVDSGLNAEEPFRYPDIDFEHVAEVEVEGLPYRAYSSGAEDNSDLTNVEQDGFEATAAIAEKNFKTFVDFTINDTPNISALYTQINVNSVLDRIRFRLYDATDDEYYLDFSSLGNGMLAVTDEGTTLPATVQKDVSGHTFEWQIANDGGSETGFVTVYSYYQTVGKHTHDPDPGVIESFPDEPNANASGELLPSNVDLLVNGTTVATDIGSGRFETTVDVSGALTPGEFNTIEATSDTLGHVKLTPFIESYKQIGTR